MCDNRNDLHKFEYEKSRDNTSTRLDLDISEITDSYPEFDFLDLLRKLQVKEKKPKLKSGNDECTNKSSVFSEEDSDVETLARLYEEKYGTCNDYAELGEGYDEEDSFIDNSDAVNDLVPNGIQTEFGGFYINRGKLNFVKEDNSSSSTSEDVDKFLAHNRLNTRKIVSDDENEEKECKTSGSNQYSSNVTAGNTSNNIINHNNNNNNNNNNSNNNYHNINSSNSNNNNSSNINNNQSSNNNNGSFHNNIAKSRKRSGEFQHKNKKIRKTATPKIPDHLLLKKPFPGSLEYRKNIKEFKKNRLKSIEADKKPAISNFIVNSRNNSVDNNTNNNHSNNVSSVNNNIDNCEEGKEDSIAKRKPAVKEVSREREVSGADVSEKQTSSSSETSDSSSSGDSDSDSSDDTSVEKERVGQKPDDPPHLNATINGSISKEITAKSFAHLSDSLKDLIAKINEISKEEKNKLFNSKLNPLLVSLDDRLRELPMAERNAVLDHIAEILQMKKDNITKRTKKLLVLQEETKMSGPLRKLKEAIATMMPLLESNYFNEYTKAAGTRSIDSNSLPQRKFPWNDELRHYLREIVQFRKNCYYIIRPRKESLIDYIRNFMEIKVKTFWPKEWMSVDILLEEAQVTSPRQLDEKQKAIPKISGSQTSSSIMQKKTSTSVSMPSVPNKKASASATLTSTVLIPPNNRKSSQGASKNSEVKSILIPRKVPQGTNTSVSPSKQNFSSSSSSLQNSLSGSRLQVTLNRLNVQEYLDRVSGSQTSICRNSNQQISPNRSQKSVSPNRLLKTSSPNSILNSNAIRPSLSKATSPNSANKTISAVRNCTNSQSVLKTIEIHSNPLPGLKTSPNSVTISPVNESIFKEISPSSEVLNLTKNSSVFISKVKDCGESKTGRSNSPSLGIPLPSGITISPTNPAPSTFLAKPQKHLERNSDVKINVSIMKQDTPISLAKDKRETMLNMNVKREGPLQNIPDCISVTSKVVQNERHKYEHVRKRALHEYQQQQQQQQLSPERLKSEEKKMKPDENLLSDMDIKDDKLDDKNFSKIFESVIAKTSETVRQSECTTSQIKQEKFGNSNLDSVTSSSGIAVRIPSVGMNQFKNNPPKLNDIRSRKDKPFLLAKNEGCVLEEGNYKEGDEKSESMKEQLVQMEMDRVMQNLVELSREKNSEYEYETQHSGYSAGSSALKPSRYQEAFQKVLFK